MSLFNNKLSKVPLGMLDQDVQDKFTGYDTSLADNAIKPESFTGTDYQKLQQAFTQAIAEKRAICISKIYDIGSNTIDLGKSYSPRNIIHIFGGGTIKKSIAGFMFNSSIAASGDYYFTDIIFDGAGITGVKVFDCTDAKLIRVTTHNCFFKDLDTIYYTNTYIQTVKMLHDTITNCSNVVLDINAGINVVIDGVLAEDCTGQFLKHGGVGTIKLLSNFSIINSCLESFTNVAVPVMSIKGTQGLNIKGNYFERHMGGSIVFDPATTTYNVSITDNYHSGVADSPCLIKWGHDLFYCESRNNFSSVKAIHDTTQMATGTVRSSNDYSPVANIESNAKFIWHVEDNMAKIEKGTFTPYVYGTTTAGTNTYSLQYGTYSRRGNLVTCDISLIMATKDAAMAGNVEIGGLPYPIKNQTGYYPGALVTASCNITLSTNFTSLNARGKLGTDKIAVMQTGSGQYRLPLPVTGIVFSTEIFIQITYEITE